MIWQLLRARKFEVKPEILELTSYCKFKLKEPKREKIDYVRPSLPPFTGAKKESVAVRGGRPKTQNRFKREIFALPFTYQSSNQADDYNFVYKIPCEEIRRQMC